MPSATILQAQTLRPYFGRCGYAAENCVNNLQVDRGATVALAAFSQRPFDSRSACIIALDVNGPWCGESLLSSSRKIGAPVAFICADNHLHWWKQSASAQSSEYLRVPARQLEGFFREHRDDLAPQTIYRAKTLGRFDITHQRQFVDLGLMPVIEQETGEIIQRLLLDQVGALREHLKLPKDISLDQGKWLVKSIFWLLGAKMLHDKEVEGFIRLDFGNVDQVFDRVARHYGQSAEAIITSERRRQALQVAANAIASRADLSLATTEALGYVYENTLISKQIRKELGTHSTPAYLIDYIVGRLAPRIELMPEDQRHVFEPACGHAGFLVAAVRLLTSLLSPEQAAPAPRRAYLRKMIQGCDVDDFAIEIARLSLTLTDIPNPNGWNLKQGDAFASDILERGAIKSHIILANPPFAAFKPEDRVRYTRKFREPTFVNKTAEMLHRTLLALPAGGVFGLVVPQKLLHTEDAKAFRKLLSESTELDEICLFPDKVFNFADVESAVLIGQRVAVRSDARKSVQYRRVREGQMDDFKATYTVTSDVTVAQQRFQDDGEHDLRVPDLEEIWTRCAQMAKMDDFFEIGQGFSFIGEDQPNFPKGQVRTSLVAREGFSEGYENLGKDVMTHQLPPTIYLNMAPEIIRRSLAGATEGVSQIIVNESPRQRGAWCIVGMNDTAGRVATTRFTIIRHRQAEFSSTALWSLVNSPFANAFAFSHSSKRNIVTGTWRKMPIPVLEQESTKAFENAVTNYLRAVLSFENAFALKNDEDRAADLDILRILHWRMDAEVLKLYNLPVELERKLLDYFNGCKRVGVPFHQDHYIPEWFEEPISLADYLAITEDWEETNSQRLKLIDKKLEGTISTDEKKELARLKQLAWAKAQLVRPLPLKEADEEEKELRRKGLWEGA